MNQRKFHISIPLLLAMTALLTVGALVAAVGVSYARYRTGQEGYFWFQPNQTAQVYLGYLEEEEFVCYQNSWETVEGTTQLSFAISNGYFDYEYVEKDQQARLRIVASLGAWQEESGKTIYLTVDDQTYTGSAVRIAEGTALYSSFGDGWIFRFLDESGNEPVWDLPGGEFSCIPMVLHFQKSVISNTALLQLQVVAEVN